MTGDSWTRVQTQAYGYIPQARVISNDDYPDAYVVDAPSYAQIRSAQRDLIYRLQNSGARLDNTIIQSFLNEWNRIEALRINYYPEIPDVTGVQPRYRNTLGYESDMYEFVERVSRLQIEIDTAVEEERVRNEEEIFRRQREQESRSGFARQMVDETGNARMVSRISIEEWDRINYPHDLDQVGQEEDMARAAIKPQTATSLPAEIVDTSSNYIEQLLKTAAGICYNELSQKYPTIREKVALRKYSNDDPLIRKKYYVDQMYHMFNEAVGEAIEADSSLRGQLERRAIINYNSDGYLTYHIYRMPSNVAEVYARIAAMLCALKTTAIMTKIMDQPLFMDSDHIPFHELTNEETTMRATLPFMGPITKSQYMNFALNTRRGLRNSNSFARMNSVILYGLLGFNPTHRTSHVVPNQYLQGQYVDMPRLKQIARSAGNIDAAGRASEAARRMAYVHLLMLRIINSIDNSGNIFAGYSRRNDLQGFVRMLSADTCLLPIWDSMMSGLGYVPGAANSISGGTNGQFDINSIGYFVDDIYGFSDQMSSDMHNQLSSLGSESTMGDCPGPTNVDGKALLAEHLSDHPALRDFYHNNPARLLEVLSKAKVGSMYDKHYLYHTILGKNYVVYPYLSSIASNNTNDSIHTSNNYNPINYSPIATMYIAGPSLASDIASRDNQNINLDAVRRFEERASTNFSPSSVFADLMAKRTPEEVFGFGVHAVPTEEDITRLASWFQTNSRVVFVTTDPAQQALRRCVKVVGGAGTMATSVRMMSAYKSAITVLAQGCRPAKEVINTMKALNNTMYPFRITELTKALIVNKYKNFAGHLNDSMERA